MPAWRCRFGQCDFFIHYGSPYPKCQQVLLNLVWRSYILDSELPRQFHEEHDRHEVLVRSTQGMELTIRHLSHSQQHLQISCHLAASASGFRLCDTKNLHISLWLRWHSRRRLWEMPYPEGHQTAPRSPPGKTGTYGNFALDRSCITTHHHAPCNHTRQGQVLEN